MFWSSVENEASVLFEFTCIGEIEYIDCAEEQ